MRGTSWGGLGTASLGWFGVLQLLVGLISIAAIPAGLGYLIRNRNSGVGAAVLALSLAPLYMFIVTLARGVQNSNVEWSEVVRSVIQLKSFLLIYLFAFLISRKNGFTLSLRMLSLYALVSAGFIVVIVIFGVETKVSTVSTSADVTRFFRAIFPTSFLVATGWLLFFYRYLTFGGVGNISASLFCLAATVLQMHRSTLVAVCVTIIVFACWFIVTRRITTSARKVLVIGSIGVVATAMIYYLSSGSGLGVAYLTASISEVTGLSANSGHRLLIISNSLDYVLSNTYGLGVGFDWERIDDMAAYLKYSFVAGPTFDSTYANVVIVLGLPGILLFAWLIWRLASLARLQTKSQDEPLARMYAMFLGSFLVFSIMVGLGTDVALISSASATFVLVLVSAVRFREIRLGRGAS